MTINWETAFERLRRFVGWGALVLAAAVPVWGTGALLASVSERPVTPTPVAYRLSPQPVFRAHVVATDTTARRAAEAGAAAVVADTSTRPIACGDERPPQAPTPDDIEVLRRRLEQLVRYVAQVERSVSRLDTALSSPAVLERQLESLKPVSR